MTASPRPAPHSLGSCAATPPAITSPHSKPAVRSTALPGSAMVKYSSRPIAATAMMKPANRASGSFQTISQREGSATAAVTSRVRSI